MNRSTLAAHAGQQQTALDQVVALLQGAPPSLGRNPVQPVEVTVGAVVKSGPGGRYLHVPHCSARFRRSPVWKYEGGRPTGEQISYRFERDELQFHDAPDDEVGLLHYFGLFGTGNDGGIVVKPIAVEWLPTPGADPVGFEYQGGAEWAAEQHCSQTGLGDFHDRYHGQVHQLIADRGIVLQRPQRFQIRVGGFDRTLCDLGIAGRFFPPRVRRERAQAANEGRLLTMFECN